MAFSGLAFACTLLLARLLGTAGFGVYSYALAWMVLLAVPALLGMDQLLIREVAASRARADWGTLRGLLRRANGAVLAVSCGLALAAGLVASRVPESPQSRMHLTFRVALLFLPLIALTRVRQAVMQGLHLVTLGAMPEQLVQPGLLLTFLGIAYSLHYRLTASAGMFANVAAAAAAFALGAYLLSRSLPPEVKRAAPVYRDREWVRSSIPLVFTAGVAVLFAQADTLILGAFKGAAAVGFYTVAHKGSELIGVVLAAQISAFASTASNLYALGEKERLQRIVTRLARWTLLISMPLAIAMIVFGRWYLLLYGPGFVQARTTLAILSVGQLGNVAMGCTGILLVMTGHEQRVAVAISVGAVANLALSFALAPRWGAEGVAIAYASSMILWNVWAAIDLYRRTGLNATALGNLMRS